MYNKHDNSCKSGQNYEGQHAQYGEQPVACRIYLRNRQCGDSQPAGGCAVSEHGGIPDAAITEVENAIIIAVNLIFILLGDIEFGNIPARCARIVAVYVIRIIGDKFKITVFPDFDR